MKTMLDPLAGLPATSLRQARPAPTLTRVSAGSAADVGPAWAPTCAPLGVGEPVTPAAVIAAELLTVHEPRGATAEAFRSLRSRLTMRATGTWDAGPLLAVVGSNRGGGRSLCAANLAVAMAQRGGTVLLVDANLRRPSLNLLFGRPHLGGLAALLTGQVEVDPVQPVAQVPGLFLLAAGETSSHPLELLEQPSFPRLMQALAARYSAVVVDTAAAAEGADAAVVAARCDAALLVTRRHHDALADVQALVDTLAHGSTPVAGVLLNGH